MATQQHNSEFLLNLLLEENKHLNTIYFIDRTDKSTNYACVCVALAIGEHFETIKENFMDNEQFCEKYFIIYTNALENYRSIVGTTIRQIFVDEAKIFYPKSFVITTLSNLVTNPVQNLDSIDNSYAIILRDEIAFTIIHYKDDDYILIDPHIEYCGIMSKDAIYRYITYDGIWDFSVSILTPENVIDKNNMDNGHIDIITST